MENASPAVATRSKKKMHYMNTNCNAKFSPCAIFKAIGSHCSMLKMNLAVLCRVVLLCTGMVAVAQAQDSCLQDIAQNVVFQKCSQEFSTVMRDLQTYTPGAIFDAICTPEGKAGMACLMGFISECPELQATMEMGGSLDLTEMMKQGGIEVMCELFTSENCRPRMDVCMEKMNDTMSEMDFGAGMSDPGNASTPYSMVPALLLAICGPMRDMLSCIYGLTDECPKTAKYMEEMIMKMSDIQKQQGGPATTSYAESKKYIMESCPSLPEDSLATPEFQKCFKNVIDNKVNYCDVYVGGKLCVRKLVGAYCGEAFADPIATAAPLFSVDIPSGCDKSVGGVNSLQALLLAKIGRRFKTGR